MPAAVSTITFSMRSQSASNACMRRRPSAGGLPARSSSLSPADTGERSLESAQLRHCPTSSFGRARTIFMVSRLTVMTRWNS
jgi:hypothetical protein